MTTRDDVMAMTPEQLRVEIAKEKYAAVEMRVCDYDQDSGELYEVESSPHCVPFPKDFDRYPCSIENDAYYPVPDWPADISAAWELVGEVNSESSYFCVWWSIEKQAWIAEIFIYNHNGECRSLQAFGGTAPAAISRAWLIWKKEREK